MACCLLLSVSVAPIARAQASAPAPSPIFVFAQPFWINLHHFLYVLGRVENKASDIQRRAVAGAAANQDAGFAALSPLEQQTWRAAVAAYAAGASKQDTVFDKDLYTATQALAAIADHAAPRGADIPAAMSAALEQAAPIYRRAWWTSHQQANSARIADLSRRVDKDGAAILAFITRTYQEPWPPAGYPVNISAFSNWAGAYSTGDRLLVVSSLDPGTEGALGLETIFHEAMHQWDDAILAKLLAAGRRQNVTRVPGGLTHTMIFYTAGEAVRRVMPDHVPYAEANEMWKNGVFATFKPVLDAAWKPYLAGSGTLDAALDDIMRRIQ